MKYIIDTLKYLKSNLLLLPALAVAVLAFSAIFDYSAAETIINSFSQGNVTNSFTAWLRLFLPINVSDWFTCIFSIVAYILLVIDTAFIHSMVDKHVRFGSKSFRSIMSSFSINFIYSVITLVLLIIGTSIAAVLFTAIMKTTALGAPYLFIAGLAICLVISYVLTFIFAHFFLWLPCAEVTGFRMSEALYSSYALARTVRWKIFAMLAITLTVDLVITVPVAIFLGEIVSLIVSSCAFGCSFLFVVVASYIIYADVEGIEREDLRKY